MAMLIAPAENRRSRCRSSVPLIPKRFTTDLGSSAKQPSSSASTAAIENTSVRGPGFEAAGPVIVTVGLAVGLAVVSGLAAAVFSGLAAGWVGAATRVVVCAAGFVGGALTSRRASGCRFTNVL